MPNIIYIVQHYSYTVQYCPLSVITIIIIIIIMKQCYSSCIPFPKSFTSVMYLVTYLWPYCYLPFVYWDGVLPLFEWMSTSIIPVRSVVYRIIYKGLCSFLTHIALRQEDFSVFSESWMRFMPSSIYPNKWTIELQNRTVYKWHIPLANQVKGLYFKLRFFSTEGGKHNMDQKMRLEWYLLHLYCRR